jgi:predicted NAD/FAD-binding protein
MGQNESMQKKSESTLSSSPPLSDDSTIVMVEDHSASYVDLGAISSNSEESSTTPLMQSAASTTNNNKSSTPKNIAIIGGGVSGLAAAWHLHVNGQQQNVHLFEAEERLGGHAWTVETIAANGDIIPVDIGFMVFNATNYPNLTEWFHCLNVKPELSNMSLSVCLDDGETVEWSSGVDGNALEGLFGSRPQQLVSPAFISFLTDMVRFNNTAADQILALHENDPRKHRTTREFLKREGYGVAFQQYYLLPMMAALWSASLNDVLEFPAVQLISFLSNHAMLQIFNRPVWQTVLGRSVQYVQAVETALGNGSGNGGGTTTAEHQQRVHCGTGIHSIQVVVPPKTEPQPQEPGAQQQPQKPKQYRLFTTPKPSAVDGSMGEVVEALPGVVFDEIIFACHAPTARMILERSGITIEPLQNIEYADNTVYVHSDTRLMPKSSSAWASWNCLGKSKELQRTMTGARNTDATAATTNNKGAFEGAESGFGNKLPMTTADDGGSDPPAEGPDGRFRAVYVT